MIKIPYVLFVLLAVFLFAGCHSPTGQNRENDYDSEAIYLSGWIVISNDRLFLNEARVYIAGGGEDDPFLRYVGENFIVASPEELERLGIDMANVMSIFPLETIHSFELTDTTEFTFISAQQHSIATTDVDEFLRHRPDVNRLYCQFDANYSMTPEEFLLRKTCKCAYYRLRNPIVIVRIQDDKVVSVIEEFVFTQ